MKFGNTIDFTLDHGFPCYYRVAIFALPRALSRPTTFFSIINQWKIVIHRKCEGFFRRLIVNFLPPYCTPNYQINQLTIYPK